MKLHLPFSSGLIRSLKITVLALLVFFGWAAIMDPPYAVLTGDPPTPPTPQQRAIGRRYARIRAGMTTQQVTQIMGKPDSMQVVPLFNSGTTYEAWHWGGAAVDFDESGHVLPGV